MDVRVTLQKTFCEQGVVTFGFENQNDNALLEACWNFLDFTNPVVNFAEPVHENWATMLHVLWSKVVWATLSFWLEALQHILHLFNIEGITQHFITLTEESSF